MTDSHILFDMDVTDWQRILEWWRTVERIVQRLLRPHHLLPLLPLYYRIIHRSLHLVLCPLNLRPLFLILQKLWEIQNQRLNLCLQLLIQ